MYPWVGGKRLATVLTLVLGFVGTFSICSYGGTSKLEGKKVLFVDSYHEDYAWSAGITRGITWTFMGTGVDLKVHRMDTKRNPSDEFKLKAALEVKQVVETFQPDVLIAADDNATKYVVEKFYKNSKLPVVFCGVNWDEKVYGYPYENTTGMIEVSPVNLVLHYLSQLPKSSVKDWRTAKIGYLDEDVLTGHKNADNIEKTFGIKMDKRFASDFATWKKEFISLQEGNDFVLLINNAGVANWNHEEAVQHVLTHGKVLSGTENDWMMPYSLLGFTKLAEEQGRWSASTAIKILQGTSPKDIPIVRNREGNLMLNMQVARRIGVEIPAVIQKQAVKVLHSEEQPKVH